MAGSISVNLSEFYDESDYENDNSTIKLNITTFICKVSQMAPAVNIIICVFYVLIFLLAMPGNILVGLVIGSTKQAFTPSDLYLFHLSVADVLLALTLPLWATAAVQGWVFSDAMCKMANTAQELSFYSSILFLVCISVDRYWVIVHAVEVRKTHRRVTSWLVCAGVWSVGFCLSISSSVFSSAVQPPYTNRTVCSEGFQLVTRVLRHTVGFLLPLAIMLGCYGVTVVHLLRMRSFRKHRAMRVIMAVVAAFLLCWAPHHAAVMTDTLMNIRHVSFSCDTRRSMDITLFVTQSMALLHSCINPVLYAFVGEKFRKNLCQLFHRRTTLERSSTLRFSRSTSQTSDAATAFM